MASTCFRWACRVSARKCGTTVYFSGFGVTRCRPVQHILCCHYTSQPEPKKSAESWWKQKYNVLETSYMNALKRFPFLYKVTTVFGKGTKLYYRDVKEGLRVRKLMKNGKPFQALTWKEMYSIRKMIHDARRVLPTLIVIALPIPLWFYVCLPMLYFFPRYLLTPHFYLPEQRIPFGHLNHYSRVTHYKNILDYLQLKTPSDQIHDKDISESFDVLINKLKSNQHSTVEELLAVKNLFIGRFSLQFLPRSQLAQLCRISSMWPYLQPASMLRNRLNSNIWQLHCMDLVIQKQGIDTLSHEDLQIVCWDRGLDSTEATKEELIIWLKDWIKLSSTVSAAESSLLVYSTVLLTVNHPTNQHHKKYLK